MESFLHSDFSHGVCCFWYVKKGKGKKWRILRYEGICTSGVGEGNGQGDSELIM